MKRHYYISDDLDDLEAIEHELEDSGVTKPHIHILSENDTAVERHNLHEVESALKQDVVSSTTIAFLVGICLAAIVLGAAYFSGFTDTFTWVPFIFLALVILGFCTWEGGLLGIQEPHHEFRRFQSCLHEGKHVLFVDVNSAQEPILEKTVSSHPKLQLAGMGSATPGWVIGIQEKWHRFIHWAP